MVALTDAVASEAATVSDFEVQYGPNGPHWCSDGLLAAIAEASARNGDARIHMHLLETRYQRAWADQAHPEGVVRAISMRSACCRRASRSPTASGPSPPTSSKLLAELAASPSSPMRAPICICAPRHRAGRRPHAAEALAGSRIGIDNSALDEDDDGLRELRLAHFLHGGWGFETMIARGDWLARNSRQRPLRQRRPRRRRASSRRAGRHSRARPRPARPRRCYARSSRSISSSPAPTRRMSRNSLSPARGSCATAGLFGRISTRRRRRCAASIATG